MRVEVINTGDELLLGRCVNTHLVYFGQRLFDVGLRVGRQISISDGDAIAPAVAEAFSRNDVVLITGGLGPTSDDLTRDAVAELLNLSMHESAEVVEAIRERLARRGREVSPEARRQALVPEGCVVLENPNGTAPGLYLPAVEGRNPHAFLLPGPPRELRPMVEAQILPRLREIVGKTAIPGVRHYKFFGMGESEVGRQLEEGIKIIPNLEYGYQVEMGNVNFRCIGDPVALAAADEIVREKLGDALVSTDESPLEKVVVEALAKRGETVATCESCTGGFIAHMLTNVSGSSAVLRRGYVTYANEAKTELVGVSAELIERHGAVSEEVAEAMVRGCLKASDDDWAIAVTGIAGPTGGSQEKPVGTVFIAVMGRGDSAPEVGRYCYPHERESFKVMVAKTAFDRLRRRLV